MGTPLLAVNSIGNPAHAAATWATAPSAHDAGPTSAWIRLQARKATRARIDWSVDAAFAQVTQGPEISLVKAGDFAAAVKLEGMPPGTTVHYRLVELAAPQQATAVGRFKTAPLQRQPFTFAYSACMHHDYRPFVLFDEIGKRNPDFFLHLGDTVYADQPRKQFVSPTLDFYRSKHRVSRDDEPLQRFLAQHLSCATWDDHEIENGANRTHSHKAPALQAFHEYWPFQAAGAEGVYRQFAWAGTDFFMLDLRSFRSPQTQSDDAQKTMLGQAQKAWLLDGLKNSQAAFKFIISSVPFHGHSDDAWGIYGTERDEIAGFIKSHKLRGVVFLTGDYHMAMDMSSKKTGLREFMAGPIAQRANYAKNPDNRARNDKHGRFHFGDGNTFGLVRVDAAAERAALEIVGADGGVLFSAGWSP